MRTSKASALACMLLLMAACRHYAWALMPAAMQGMASKGLGAAATLCLLLLVWQLIPRAWRTLKLLAVVAWYAWEETQTLVCSVSYLFDPWPVTPGIGICSARIDFDLGALGLVVLAALAIWNSSHERIKS